MHKFDAIINEKEIDDDGLSADVQITLELSGVSLESTLDLMLESHDLDYIVKDEVLMITSRSKAEEYLELRVYDLNDFVPLIGELDKDSLKRHLRLIKQSVGSFWEEEEANGGTMAIGPGVLAVRQNQRTHREIENLIEQLRRATEEE